MCAAKQRAAASRIARIATGKPALVLHDSRLDLPDGAPLQAGINVEIHPGEAWLGDGPDRRRQEHAAARDRRHMAVRTGEHRDPRRRTNLFLPQKPYLPIGTLRSVLSYPSPRRRSTTMRCAKRWLPAACRTLSTGSTSRVTGRSNSPRRTAAHRFRACAVATAGNGCFSTRPPLRSTRGAKRVSTASSGSGCRTRHW